MHDAIGAVTEPTRYEHLLDLVLTDLESCKTEVLPRIADHKLVVVELKADVPSQACITRKVWSFTQADWGALQEDLAGRDWATMWQTSVEEATEFLTGAILDAASNHIPTRVAKIKNGPTRG